MVSSFEEHLKKTQHVPEAPSSRAAQAEYEVNSLKKNMVNLEEKKLTTARDGESHDNSIRRERVGMGWKNFG